MKRVVGRRLATFPAMEMSDGEWAAWWSDYVDALGDLTEASLEAGMRAYVRDPKADWMAKPGRLRELAQGATTAAAVHYARAKAAVEMVHERNRPPLAKPPPEAVGAMMADFRARMDRRREERARDQPATRRAPSEPPISAETVETGVSSELLRQVYAEPAETVQEVAP